MRASPACRVSLQHFGVWRAGVCALALAGAASLGAWLSGRQATPLSWLFGLAVGLLIAGSAVSLWRMPARNLHWDGQVWRLDALPGELDVAIDLGPWMLLRFRPETPGRRIWLPVQRPGLESQWHALRCAVYSPRAAAEA